MAVFVMLLFIVFPAILIVLSVLMKRYRYIVFLLAILLPVSLIAWNSDMETILVNLDAIALYTIAYCTICGVTMMISAKLRNSI
ncbi:hypothetical protein [Alkalicoccobacillus porphyridii]|uniref:DUF2651 domain-containing protein n=1 Tax=Alkalicoccobacillus porphyridii TaxID=2597270 RepID=A0A553ZXB2_9BACI|nr:hypothetical protein [Alkalicoccobacillus porphyridii]TSB46045.1 hypothetical protein FN960_14195 [Alkalicoccobacillus porphyridii]